MLLKICFRKAQSKEIDSRQEAHDVLTLAPSNVSSSTDGKSIAKLSSSQNSFEENESNNYSDLRYFDAAHILEEQQARVNELNVEIPCLKHERNLLQEDIRYLTREKQMLLGDLDMYDDLDKMKRQLNGARAIADDFKNKYVKSNMELENVIGERDSLQDILTKIREGYEFYDELTKMKEQVEDLLEERSALLKKLELCQYNSCRTFPSFLDNNQKESTGSLENCQEENEDSSGSISIPSFSRFHKVTKEQGVQTDCLYPPPKVNNIPSVVKPLTGPEGISPISYSGYLPSPSSSSASSHDSPRLNLHKIFSESIQISTNDNRELSPSIVPAPCVTPPPVSSSKKRSRRRLKRKIASFSSSSSSSSDEFISKDMDFFLPKIGPLVGYGASTYPTIIEDSDGIMDCGDDFSNPISLSNVLRPWQVDFLTSMNITTTSQFIFSCKSKPDGLAKKMVRWRQKHNYEYKKFRSCRVAIHIWARTVEAKIKSHLREYEQCKHNSATESKKVHNGKIEFEEFSSSSSSGLDLMSLRSKQLGKFPL